MMDPIDSVAALEAVIGKTPPPVQLKVIDHLDESALRWLAASPLMFAAFGDASGVAATLGGGAPGFAAGETKTFRLPLATLDDPGLAAEGANFGSLFLAPGLGETLRVNGRVEGVRDGEALIAVQECYVHCAKALIRSSFWSAEPCADPPVELEDFVAQSRFMALATIDAGGRADLSPKGDPAGAMAMMNGGDLWFADRPGNRRADSFRNILSQAKVGAALLVPGSSMVALVRGVASLTTEAPWRERFVVQDKTPRLVVRVEDLTAELRASPALQRAGLWPLREPAEGLNPADMLAAHVKLNKEKGLAAKLAGAIVSIPGLMQRGLDQDYKSNLY